MKLMKRLSLLALLVAISAVARAGTLASGNVLEKTCQPIAFTSDLDISDLDRFAVQAVYSDGTPSSHTLVDGSKGTATLTVISTTGISGSTIKINGVTLTFGVDIATKTTTALQAKAISDAIVATTALQSVVVSSHSAAVVYATAAVVGAETYSVTSSLPAKIQWNKGSVAGGTASDFSTDDSITKASHGLTTGLKVLFSSATGTAPTGLTSGVTYYAIRTNDSSYKLALTSTGAVAGLAVDITALRGSGTFTMAPLAIVAGTAGFAWQGSVDGTNFSNLSVSSVTYSTAGSTLWDFGQPNYRYLRINFVGPTSGGIALTVKLNGRKF